MLILLAALVTVIAFQVTKRRPQQPAAAPVAAAPGAGVDPWHGSEVLERRIDELRLRRATLGEAVDVLREKTGAPIAVRWAALNVEAPDGRMDPESRISLWLRGVSLGTALR